MYFASGVIELHFLYDIKFSHLHLILIADTDQQRFPGEWYDGTQLNLSSSHQRDSLIRLHKSDITWLECREPDQRYHNRFCDLQLFYMPGSAFLHLGAQLFHSNARSTPLYNHLERKYVDSLPD